MPCFVASKEFPIQGFRRSYWLKGKTLSIFTSFVTEEVYVGISHYIIGLHEVQSLSRVSSK